MKEFSDEQFFQPRICAEAAQIPDYKGELDIREANRIRLVDLSKKRFGIEGFMDNRNDKNNKPAGPNKNGLFICLIAALIFVMFFSYISRQLSEGTTEEITYNEFLSMLEKGNVDTVTIGDDRINIIPKQSGSIFNYGYSAKTYYTGIMPDYNLNETLRNAGVTYTAEVIDKSTTIFDIILAYVVPFVLIYVVMWFLFRMITKNGGGMMGGVGKSNAKVYVEKDTGVTFKDVAGQEEAKESISELVDFLHNPGKYTKIGAKLPKGALLVGPPGTGKTLLAKAVAGEAHVPFFSLAGSDFVEMYVGVGASRVRDLFKQAQSQAPCIVFIDEIDAIGKSRDSRYGGGNDEREQTLNQLLSEMDGFDTSKGIVILAATNRPEVLDKALLRPGRFDRRIIVDKPDLKGRIDILKVHAKNVLMHDSVDLEAIALATAGAVGSDLANIINEAAILAVKEGRTVVKQSDLFESVEVVFAGKEKKDRILGKEEKKIVAYHEVGHALITALEKNTEPVQKITIVPRTMGALGYTMMVPEEEKYLKSKAEMVAQITTLYGGRAAEEVVFDSITTGASNDIERATAIARAMITRYGMSEKFGLMGLETVENPYLDGRSMLNCGDSTAAEIDHEILELLRSCYDRAKELLSENREALDRIAEYLYEKETITGKEFMKLFNEINGIADSESAEDDKEDIKNSEDIKEDSEVASSTDGKDKSEAETSADDKEDSEVENDTDDESK